MFYSGSAWIWIVAAFPISQKISKNFLTPLIFALWYLRSLRGQALKKISEVLYMEKLVRVIKLRPGESVLIIAEEPPAPCPYGGFCMAPKRENEFSQSKGILVHIDGAA